MMFSGLFESPEERKQRYEETIANRKIALRWARDAASRGDPLAGSLSELERHASESMPGWEFAIDDEDDSDLDVFP